jgi:hypothetical protein
MPTAAEVLTPPARDSDTPPTAKGTDETAEMTCPEATRAWAALPPAWTLAAPDSRTAWAAWVSSPEAAQTVSSPRAKQNTTTKTAFFMQSSFPYLSTYRQAGEISEQIEQIMARHPLMRKSWVSFFQQDRSVFNGHGR